MWMLTVPTPLDHMYVHASLDTLETDKLAQVILISFLQSQLFKAEGNLNLLLSQIVVAEVMKYLS